MPEEGDIIISSMTLKTILCCLCAVLILVSPAFSITAQANSIRMGYSSKTLFDVDIKDAAAALQVWTKEIAASLGWQARADLYEDLNPLIQDLQAGKLDLVALKSLDYLRIAQSTKSDLAFTAFKSGKKTLKYMLLARVDSDVKELSNLRGKTISIMNGDETGMLFLETVLLRKNLPESRKFFSSIEAKGKLSQVILSVFFNQADVCLTNDSGFNIMKELNPQIGQKMKIIAESPEIVESLAFFRGDYDASMKKSVIRRALKLGDTPRGQQVQMLFKISGLTTINEQDLFTLKRLLKEYEQYSKKKWGFDNSAKQSGRRL